MMSMWSIGRVGHGVAVMAAFLGLWLGVARADEPSSQPAASSAVQPRIDERFAVDGSGETSDFRRHVLPLMGRLGCNGRACHGSFQGQGGFRLSLFGYDFKADHENLTAGEKPRADRAQPAASLMLRKPLEEEPHEGGQVLVAGSWQHRVLLEWIKGGATDPGAAAVSFVDLEVTPTEMVAAAPGDAWQLRAVAVWSDGSREDVTPLCRFQSNDDQVATVDQAGRVTAVGPGDSHVVAFYDNGVVPVPVIFPVSDRTGPAYPDVPTPTPIDELVIAKLRKLGEVPADLCTDAEFLRRVSLDMTGTPPTVAEVEAFLADGAADKRARKIDELLERPGYASWWATKFCDWTGNNAQKNQNQGPDRRDDVSRAWHQWIRERIARNVPYDEIVEGIVLARSRLDGESYEDYCRRMSGYMAKGATESFAEQPYLPYFWSRANFRTDEERALGFAYTFLGVRIQCAQCHKHPFDQWTKDDFDRFENFFGRVRYGEVPGTRDEARELLEGLGIDEKKTKGNQLSQELAKLVAKGQVVPFRETYVVAPTKPRVERAAKGERTKVVAGRTATVLGGEETRIDELDDPREVLMDWMRDDDNPYFARAIVNRIWAGYFNVGIVEPPDDLSLANPPSNEPLLDWLAAEFRSRGYDLKWLHREIARSDTYQRSWRVNDTNRLDERNFARAVPRRIPAEVIVDTIRIATAGDSEADALARGTTGRAIADPVVGARSSQYALTVFGRSIRESNCDCDRTTEPSLLQTVYLQNDAELLALIGRKGGWVDQVVAAVAPAPTDDVAGKRRVAARTVNRAEETLAKARRRDDAKAIADAEKRLATARRWLASLEPAPATDEEVARATLTATVETIVRGAYLRTLGRPPESAEAARAAAYFHDTPDLAVGTRDLLWALLNTKEFAVNH